MKYCHTFTKLVSLIIITSFLFSCGKDNVEPAPDLSINSDDNLEITSKHENGWIKEAVIKYHFGATKNYFEYHENGYIKSVKTYELIPEHHLFSSIERDENNLPLSSTYYYPNGDTFLSVSYENGVISDKTLFAEDGVKTVSKYTNGQVTLIEKTGDTNGVSVKVEFDYTAQKKTLSITSGNNLIHSEELPLELTLGSGISTNNDLLISNFMSDSDIRENRILTSSSSTIGWKTEVDPLSFVPAPVVYDKWIQVRKPSIELKFIANSDIYRGVYEQYPFVERRGLVAGFQSAVKKFTISPSFEKKIALGEQLRNNQESFTRLYGDEFSYENITGKYLILVATLRNMPSDSEVRKDIENIAWRHASNLISGSDVFDISTEERMLLSKVFFELKLHSSSLNNSNGVVIDDYDDYKIAEETIENAPEEVIQRNFRTYSSIALNN